MDRQEEQGTDKCNALFEGFATAEEHQQAREALIQYLSLLRSWKNARLYKVRVEERDLN